MGKYILRDNDRTSSANEWVCNFGPANAATDDLERNKNIITTLFQQTITRRHRHETVPYRAENRRRQTANRACTDTANKHPFVSKKKKKSRAKVVWRTRHAHRRLLGRWRRRRSRRHRRLCRARHLEKTRGKTKTMTANDLVSSVTFTTTTRRSGESDVGYRARARVRCDSGTPCRRPTAACAIDRSINIAHDDDNANSRVTQRCLDTGTREALTTSIAGRR